MKIARIGAVVGGVVWLIISAAPINPNFGIGTIEKMFLFAPLVTVPLGLRLARVQTPLERLIITCQFPAALLAVAAFFIDQGWLSACLAVPWGMLTGMIGFNGILRFRNGAYRQPEEACFATAMTLLPIGGMSLLQSRLGLTPLGYNHTIVLLTAVHYHFAAFAAPMITGGLGRTLRGARDWRWGIYRALAPAVILGSPVLAAGYILFTPALRLLGAILLVSSLVGVAMLTLSVLPRVQPALARLPLTFSALAVVVAMVYAIVYAVADFYGEVWIAIPQMARTHGVLNALVFGFGGLLGWKLVGSATANRVAADSINPAHNLSGMTLAAFATKEGGSHVTRA